MTPLLRAAAIFARAELPQDFNPADFLPSGAFPPADSTRALFKTYATELFTNPEKFFGEMMMQVLDFGLKVLCAFLIYAIGILLIKWIKKTLRKLFLRRKTERTVASFMMSIVSISLTVVLIAVVIAALGVNTASFAALLAAGGMAVGMALSGLLQNFAGGIMILGFKPFKAGDHILSQGYEGIVTEVNIVSTRIRTFDNAVVILPNGTLFNSNIINVTNTRLRRLTWEVDVAYGSDAEEVKGLIAGIINADGRVLHAGKDSDPVIYDPLVNIKELKESGVLMFARAWTREEDYWDVYYKVLEEIYRQLPAHGVGFPFPQLDVHLERPEQES